MGKFLKVAEARARFGEILDTAEQGDDVVIERRGVLFRVVAEKDKRRGEAPAPLFDYVAPAVMSGQWTWTAGPKGLRFSRRRKRR